MRTSSNVTALPFLIALLLGAGTLLFYLLGALLTRATSHLDADQNLRDFNLGIPRYKDKPELFGISLAAASTPLSTIFTYFLLAAPSLGLRLFISPVMFALGTLLLFEVYKRAAANGFLDESTSDGKHSRIGLLPCLAERISGSRGVGVAFLVLCLLPVLALLALEISVGTQFIETISANAFGSADMMGTFSWMRFLVFALFLFLMLGYVFVGGFPAVVASDIWQYKTIKLALAGVIATFIALAWRGTVHLSSNALWPASPSNVASFYVPMVLVNLIAPLSLQTSWQRFGAFALTKKEMGRAAVLAVRKQVLLWTALIVVGLLASAAGMNADRTLPTLLNGVASGDSSVSLLMFPLLTVAAFSAMYSTADTCVSSIFYLTEYVVRTKGISSGAPLGSYHRHYLFMSTIVALTLGVYFIVNRALATGGDWIVGLFTIMTALFASLCVIAPTVAASALLSSARAHVGNRAGHILASLIIGSIGFWSCFILGLCLGIRSIADCAVIPGLLLSSIPACMLVRRERFTKEGDDGWGDSGIHRARRLGANGTVRT